METNVVADKGNMCCQKLSVCALGFAVGISWAIGVLLLGLLAWQFGYGHDAMHLFSSVYKGFVTTPIGIVIGTVWAFVDGFVGGVIIAFVYNKVVKSHHCKMCCPVLHDVK